MNSILSQKQASFPFSATKINNKAVHLSFDGGDLSNDAGGLILREAEREVGIIRQIVSHLTDLRDSNKIEHSLTDLLMQRISQIACGYEDGNDCDRLRRDPIFKMIAGRLPQTGVDLASQPTMCRFENSVDKAANDALENALIDHFIAARPETPDVIIVDADQTADIGHGRQEELFFNGYYNEYCFMPLHIYEGLSGDLITTLLMPGMRPTGEKMLEIIKALITKLRAAWPKTLIVFRGDSHFSFPEVHDWIDLQQHVKFITGLSGNSCLRRLAQHTIEVAEKKYETTGRDVERFHSFGYRAGSWSKMRRVVVKVEVTAKGTNVRYVVSNMPDADATALYKIVYCGRGVAELYIKDHKTHLKSDRTSCHDYQANRFRLLMHSAAYILLHQIRKNLLAKTQWAKATLKTIQLKFLKVCARIRELETRIKVEINTSYPQKDVFRRCFEMMEIIRQT